MSTSPKKKMKFYQQNKSKYYNKSNKEQYLAPGMQGFLATCNFREKDCIREAYNILNHYADELFGPEQLTTDNVEKTSTTEATKEVDEDASDLLKKEVDALNNQRMSKKNSRRFNSVGTGANNCVFIRATIPDPVELGARIVDDIRTTGEQRTRFLLRLVPIEAVCRINELEATAGQLFDKHFLKEGSTYSIVFNRRFNNDVKREKTIEDLAELVQSKNIANRVDLKNPEKTVVVEIIKGLCLMSVITGYIQNKKYNLVELANIKNNSDKEPTEVEEASGEANAEKDEKADEKAPNKEEDEKELESNE